MIRFAWQKPLRKFLSRTGRPVQFWLRRQLLRAVDSLALCTEAQPDPTRVLLVRVDHIGDFVLWLGAAMDLAEHYRAAGKHVTLLGDAVWAAWAEELGIFDAVLPLETERYKTDLRYRVRTARNLRRLGCGWAVHAAPTRVPELGDSLLRVSGATHRVGPDAEQRRMPRLLKTKSGLYNHLIRIGVPASSELSKNAALASGIVCRPLQARIADLRGMVTCKRLGPIESLLPHGPYFVLFPGASHPGRKWPVRSFAEVAARLRKSTGWAGVVCGGPGDRADAARLASEAGDWLTNLAGETDLGQLAAVLAGAQLLISNETSAIHMAAALGVPSVCVVGGGHFGRFVPYDVEATEGRFLPRAATHLMPCFGCNWMCRFHPGRGEPMPCIEGVTVEAVWAEVSALLTEHQGISSPARVAPFAPYPTKGEAHPALVAIGVGIRSGVTFPSSPSGVAPSAIGSTRALT